MKHIMLDIETMGRNAGCVVLSVAGVAFEKDLNLEDFCYNSDLKDFEDFKYLKDTKEINFSRLFSDTVDFNLNVTEQLMRGYRVEGATQDWWMQQSEEAKRDQICSTVMSLRGLCETLRAFFKRNSDEEGVCVWAQGTDFDISILRKIFHDEMGEDSEPWNHRNIRDSRTYIAEVGKMVLDDPYKDIPRLGGTQHTALYDAKQSAFNVACISTLFRLKYGERNQK